MVESNYANELLGNVFERPRSDYYHTLAGNLQTTKSVMVDTNQLKTKAQKP